MIFCKPQNNDLEPNSYIHKPNFDERVCYHMIVPSNLTYPFCVQIPLKLKTPKKQTESTLSNEPYFSAPTLHAIFPSNFGPEITSKIRKPKRYYIKDLPTEAAGFRRWQRPNHDLASGNCTAGGGILAVRNDPTSPISVLVDCGIP